MTRDQRFSDEELWQPDGHPSELSLTALADGEPGLVTREVADHVEHCADCAHRLGGAAMFSLSVSEALTAARSAAPFPVWAVAAGMILAGVGAVPAIWQLPSFVYELPRTVAQTAPIAFRVGMSVVKAASNAGPSLLVVWLSATLVLAVLGFAVARQVPRQVEWKGAR